MGNAESQPVRNVDKRTARRDHAGRFKEAIARYREEQHQTSDEPAPFIENGASAFMQRCKVAVRRRPIFPHELTQGEFDVVTCGRSHLVIHDCRMHADCRRLFVSHHTFRYDRVYDERTSSRDVYAGSVAPLVALAASSKSATVLMYGQTGSGKTFTMRAIFEAAAADLFAAIDVAAGDVITCAYAELAQGGARDILNGGAAAQLLADHAGETQIVPSVEVQVTSAAGLVGLLEFASALRSTSATGVHDASSRSHAICRIAIQRHDRPKGNVGLLTLVDLAGSEMRIDSDKHDAKRTKESAMINSSLMALKDSVRALARGGEWGLLAGRSPLTKVLKASFTDADASTLVLATVSPAAKDTEHSLNTLRHACIMDGQQDEEAAAAVAWTSGGESVVEEIGEIDQKSVMAKRKAEAKVAEGAREMGGGGGFGIGGRDTMGDPMERAKAEALKAEKEAKAAYARQERKAWKALSDACIAQYSALKEARASASTGPSMNQLQMERLRWKLQLQREASLASSVSSAPSCGPPRASSIGGSSIAALETAPEAPSWAVLGGSMDGAIDTVMAETGCALEAARRAVESVGGSVDEAIELVLEAQRVRAAAARAKATSQACGSAHGSALGSAVPGGGAAREGAKGGGGGVGAGGGAAAAAAAAVAAAAAAGGVASCRGGFGKAVSARSSRHAPPPQSAAVGPPPPPPPLASRSHARDPHAVGYDEDDVPRAYSGPVCNYELRPSYADTPPLGRPPTRPFPSGIQGAAAPPTSAHKGEPAWKNFPPPALDEPSNWDNDDDSFDDVSDPSPGCIRPSAVTNAAATAAAANVPPPATSSRPPPLTHNRPRYGRRSSPASDKVSSERGGELIYAARRVHPAVMEAAASAAIGGTALPLSPRSPRSPRSPSAGGPSQHYGHGSRARAPVYHPSQPPNVLSVHSPRGAVMQASGHIDGPPQPSELDQLHAMGDAKFGRARGGAGRPRTVHDNASGGSGGGASLADAMPAEGRRRPPKPGTPSPNTPGGAGALPPRRVASATPRKPSTPPDAPPQPAPVLDARIERRDAAAAKRVAMDEARLATIQHKQLQKGTAAPREEPPPPPLPLAEGGSSALLMTSAIDTRGAAARERREALEEQRKQQLLAKQQKHQKHQPPPPGSPPDGGGYGGGFGGGYGDGGSPTDGNLGASSTLEPSEKELRGQQAKERREKAEEAKRLALLEKQQQKEKKKPPPSDHEAAAAELEAAIAALPPGRQSDAARSGLMKQLAAHRAVALREQRKREQEEREARRIAEANAAAARTAAARAAQEAEMAAAAAAAYPRGGGDAADYYSDED